MSALLQNWLNNEVGLSTNVANFERDFSNGYLFGEILHKFRQQEDFDTFANKNTYETKIANFKRLEPTLKALGIKCNAAQSTAMMGGERGASLRLLYQMKMATERLMLAADPGAGAQGGQAQAQAVPTGGGVTKGIRIPRDVYDGHERNFFEHRLRATCPNMKQARVDKLTQKFDDERSKQEIVAFEANSLQQAQIAEQREIHRFSLRERMRQNRSAKDEWNRQSYELWADTMQVRAEREDSSVEYQLRVQGRRDEKFHDHRDTAAEEVRRGVEVFESGLVHLGLSRERKQVSQADESSDSDRSEHRGDRLLAKTTPATNARALVESLREGMPSPQELEQEAGLFLRKIKESKRAGSIARRERERRRRRVLVEQQREQEHLEEAKLEEVLLETLSRESIEERRINYSVWRTNKYEDVIVSNRQLRASEQAARRKKDQQEALRKDKELCEDMLEALRETGERERVRYRAIERGRIHQHHAQLSEECEGILGLVEGMAFAALHQEQLSDETDIDGSLWREWTALFVENVPVPAPRPLEESMQEAYPVAAVPPAEPDAEDVPQAILEEATLRDFLAGREQWQEQDLSANAAEAGGAVAAWKFDAASQMELLLEECASFSYAARLSKDIDVVDDWPVNYRLGTLVASLLERAYAQAPLPPPPPMPEVSLRLVLSGKKYSGKRTLAARLGEAYGLQVVDLDLVVRECLLLSKRPDLASAGPIDVMSFTNEQVDEECARQEEIGNPYMRQLQDIGYALQQTLDAGEAIDNETYVNMIATKIRCLFPDRMPKEADVDAAAQADNTPAAVDIPVFAATPGPDDDGDGLGTTQPIGGDDAGEGEEHEQETRPPSPSAVEATEDAAPLEPCGWILTGFPEDKAQFELFERFLSGWVPHEAAPVPEAEIQKAGAGLIAPAPPQPPPVFKPVLGGYDLHIRLEILGEEAVRRAAGRRVDPATGLHYHLEDLPPCMKNQIIYERLLPVDDLANSTGSLAARLHSFDIAQQQLEPLLAYFGPVPDVERLVSIDGQRPVDAVYDSLEEQVAMLLERKGAQHAQGLADAQAAAAAATAAAAQAPPEESLQALVAAAMPPEGAPPEELPVPEPLTLADLADQVVKLEDSVFALLLEQWRELQHNLLADAKQLVRWCRAQQSSFACGLHWLQQHFSQFLQRTDDKQVLVDAFIFRCNAFSEQYPDMRKQDAAKAELHQQVDDLHDQLKEKVGARHAECAAFLLDMEQSQWVEAQVETLAAHVQYAVQLEARRYHTACQLISDFYWSALGEGLPPARTPLAKIDCWAEKEEEAPPEEKKGKPPAKGKKEEEATPEDPAVVRAAKLRKRAEASNGGVVAWEFPFLGTLLDQAKAMTWKAEEYGAPVAYEVPEEVVESKAKGKAKAKAKGKAAPTETLPEPAKPTPALFVDMQQALLAERVNYSHRLNLIENRSRRRLLKMSDEAEDCFRRLHDWLVLRRHKELDGVAGLMDIFKEHIESEDLITSRLTLEGAHLHCHPNVLLKAPVPPLVLPPVERAAPYRWSIEQLEGLLEMLHRAANATQAGGSPGGSLLMSASGLLSMLVRLTPPAQSAASEQPPVPQGWRPCDAERLHSFCCLFDHPPRCGTVDCVEVLFSIGLLHSPLGWPTLDSLMKTRATLEGMMPKGCKWPDFCISAAQFESLPLREDPGGLEAALARKFAGKVAIEPAVYDRGKAQQRWLGKVLQRFPAGERQQQAWELEMAWYKYQVQTLSDHRRRALLFDDVTPARGAGHDAADAMSSLVGAAGPEPGSPTNEMKSREWKDLSAPPTRPTLLPRDAGSISVRQFMTYLCQGASPAEGLARATQVLQGGTPKSATHAPESTRVPVQDFHAALLQLGARPTPPSADGDGRPSLPSLARLVDELTPPLPEGATDSPPPIRELSVAEFFANPRAQALLARMGLGRRHCRPPVEKLFPTTLKPGS